MKSEPAKITVRPRNNRREKAQTVRGFGVFSEKDSVYLYFKSSEDNASNFHLAKSTDGFSFEKETSPLSIKKSRYSTDILSTVTNFTIIKVTSEYLLLYKKLHREGVLHHKAWSKDLRQWEYEGEMSFPTQKPASILPTLVDKKYLAFTTSDSLLRYSSKDLLTWKKDFDTHDTVHTPESFNIHASFETDKGILLILSYKIHHALSLYVVLVDKNSPDKFLWMGREAVWTTPQNWNHKQITSLGTVLFKDMLIGYWQLGDEGIYATIYSYYKTHDGITSKNISLNLDRSHKNPLISPNPKNNWEEFTTFNPAAIYDNGKVHLLYRAQGHDYVSVLGYATSRDGTHIDERFDTPAYIPTEMFDTPSGIDSSTVSRHFMSGGGFGGCEDPRITKLDDRYYLTYVAFDGMSPPRVALTSISTENFLNKRWLWEKPVIISPPGVVDKSAVIFPEKIGGKYVIMHRIYPDILIDYVDSLNFDGTTYLQGQYKISPRASSWDSRKIGAGAPPIKTPYGWLLIYQSVGDQDSGRYKIGAMLLDLERPYIVLHRSKAPILEPTASYENDGFKAGVIYPCGAVVIGDTLYVYYGGADSYVCVATANLDHFLKELMYSELGKLTNPITEKII